MEKNLDYNIIIISLLKLIRFKIYDLGFFKKKYKKCIKNRYKI